MAKNNSFVPLSIYVYIYLFSQDMIIECFAGGIKDHKGK